VIHHPKRLASMASAGLTCSISPHHEAPSQLHYDEDCVTAAIAGLLADCCYANVVTTNPYNY